jgi:hypothetical protein
MLMPTSAIPKSEKAAKKRPLAHVPRRPPSKAFTYKSVRL